MPYIAVVHVQKQLRQPRADDLQTPTDLQMRGKYKKKIIRVA